MVGGLLSHRWLTRLACAWALVLGLWPQSGAGAPLPPRRSAESQGDLAPLGERLEQQLIRARLLELGASSEDAEAVIARLSPEERAELAARVDELEPGGSAFVAALAVLILAGLIVVLVLELLGRRVVSQP